MQSTENQPLLEHSPIILPPRPQTMVESFFQLQRSVTDYYGRFNNRRDYYEFKVPLHPYFQAMQARLRDLTVSDSTWIDWEEVRGIHDQEAYPNFDFVPGIKAVQQAMPQMNQVLAAYQELAKAWGFQLFTQYEIQLVMFTIGGGGSWLPVTDDQMASLTFFYDATRKRTPAESLSHEIFHTGIQWLMKKYGLTQQEEEVIVDKGMMATVQNFFPNYRPQKGLQAQPLEQELSLEAVRGDLPATIERYIVQNPR